MRVEIIFPKKVSPTSHNQDSALGYLVSGSLYDKGSRTFSDIPIRKSFRNFSKIAIYFAKLADICLKRNKISLLLPGNIWVLHIYIYKPLPKIFLVITASECSKGRAIYKKMITKGSETTQSSILLKLSYVSSNHRVFV